MNKSEYEDDQEPAINALIMMDRDVDKISPFYLNQTYEGLLDEFFGINTTCVKVSNQIVYQDEK
jgi:hypothetical protein